MRSSLFCSVLRGAAAVTMALILGSSGSAQTVWSGLTKTFTKAFGSDYTLPQNQDALTENVVLTRGDSGGLINYAAESGYTHGFSPRDTLWATNINNPSETIAATNWQNLEFTSWINAYGGPFTQGSLIAGRDAVVFLSLDDVYLDLRFTSWSPSGGGGYSYQRAEPPTVVSPSGDYNGNSVVDAADYIVWRKTLNQPAVPAGSGADGNANGTIDAGDYDFWVERFGNVIPGSGSIAVPEPTAINLAKLMVLVLTVLFTGRRNWHSTSVALTAVTADIAIKH